MGTPYIPALRRLREAAGMAQNQLAQASGVNARQIRRVESGDSDAANLTLRNALALAAALGVRPEELMDAPPPRRNRKMTNPHGAGNRPDNQNGGKENEKCHIVDRKNDPLC